MATGAPSSELLAVIIRGTTQQEVVWAEVAEDPREKFRGKGEDVRHCYGREREWDVDSVFMRYEHSMSK